MCFFILFIYIYIYIILSRINRRTMNLQLFTVNYVYSKFINSINSIVLFILLRITLSSILHIEHCQWIVTIIYLVYIYIYIHIHIYIYMYIYIYISVCVCVCVCVCVYVCVYHEFHSTRLSTSSTTLECLK